MNAYSFKTWYKLPNEMVTSLNVFGKMINSMNGEDVILIDSLPNNKIKGFKTRNVGPKMEKIILVVIMAAINFDTTSQWCFQI